MTQWASWTIEQGVIGAVLAAAMVIASYTDIRWRRLPNWLTLGVAAFGLTYQLGTRGLDGGRDSLLGWGLGCALLFLPFAMGGMGAGDVKLLGAVGALKGASFVLNTFVFMAVAGAVLAIVTMAKRGTLLSSISAGLGTAVSYIGLTIRYRSLPPLGTFSAPSRQAAAVVAMRAPTGELKHFGIPYGVAIAAGSLLALLTGH